MALPEIELRREGLGYVPMKVLDVELSEPIEDVTGLHRYSAVYVVLRLGGTPIDTVILPLEGGRCAATVLAEVALEKHEAVLRRYLKQNGATPPLPDGPRLLDELPHIAPAQHHGPTPTVTVAVCTRDRSYDLERCLDALKALRYPHLDVLIVDNAPTRDSTRSLVTNQYPQMRYVCEPRPGLNWARNRAIAEARGEIIAFTDDDVIVDPGWVNALVRAFAEHPDVMATTGLVVPYELETEAQILFEANGGFGRGFKQKRYLVDHTSKRKATFHYGPGEFGTGANMAFRRAVFDHIGCFDPALDVGTPTRGGGDIEMFFRVLQEGHALAYEPAALVRHRHRRTYDELLDQYRAWGSYYAFLARSIAAYPEERIAMIRYGVHWFWRRYLRRLLGSFVRRRIIPRELILAEMKGALRGLSSYADAQRAAREIEQTFGAPAAHPSTSSVSDFP